MSYELVVVNIGEEESARNLLKAEMARRGVSLQTLTDLMQKQNPNVTKASIANKISRGGFSADFFLVALRAMSCTELGFPKKSFSQINEEN